MTFYRKLQADTDRREKGGERERERHTTCNNCCIHMYNTYSHVRHLHGHTSRCDSARRVFDMFSVTVKCSLCAHANMTGMHTNQRNGNGPVDGFIKQINLRKMQLLSVLMRNHSTNSNIPRSSSHWCPFLIEQLLCKRKKQMSILFRVRNILSQSHK